MKLQDGDEIFHFMTLAFNVSELKRLVEAGEARGIETKFYIKNYAEQILALDRNQPDKIPTSVYVHIDKSYLQTITDERLQDPLYLVETEYGFLVVDGNHRLARAYLKGIEELPVVCFLKVDTQKVLCP